LPHNPAIAHGSNVESLENFRIRTKDDELEWPTMLMAFFSLCSTLSIRNLVEWNISAIMQGIVCGFPDDGIVLLYLAVAAQSALEGSENGV
jgi:hypothetical protein